MADRVRFARIKPPSKRTMKGGVSFVFGRDFVDGVEFCPTFNQLVDYLWFALNERWATQKRRQVENGIRLVHTL